MGLVTDVDDEMAPTVLLVDNNPMSVMRLSNLFKTKNFAVEICEDGDKAVDEYIRLDPELVVLSLDLPSLDGHLAALEMREHGGEQRIVFVAPSRMAELATNAAYSAGAVAWLQKPVSAETLEAIWAKIEGPLPEAPGLEDLDQLYPEDRVKPEDDSGPILPPLPLPGQPLPGLPLPSLPLEMPELVVSPTVEPMKKGRGKLFIGLFILLFIGGAAAAWQMGYLP